MLMKTENLLQAFPLSMTGESNWVKIVSVIGGKNLVKRLAAMGMVEGTVIQVLQCHGKGNVIVRCGETRLALGIGMAHKIMVEPMLGGAIY